MRIFSRRKEVQAFVDEQIARRHRIALVALRLAGAGRAAA
jgi:hypothetical protein